MQGYPLGYSCHATNGELGVRQHLFCLVSIASLGRMGRCAGHVCTLALPAHLARCLPVPATRTGTCEIQVATQRSLSALNRHANYFHSGIQHVGALNLFVRLVCCSNDDVGESKDRRISRHRLLQEAVKHCRLISLGMTAGTSPVPMPIPMEVAKI